MQKVIQVEAILPKNAPKSGQPYWIMRSQGEGYFVWDKEMIRTVKVGDTIKLEYEPSRYPRVSSIAPQKMLPVAPAESKPHACAAFPVEVTVKGHESKPKTRDERIEEMHDEKTVEIRKAVALKAAIDYIVGQIVAGKLDSKKDTIEMVLKVAETFEKWLERK